MIVDGVVFEDVRDISRQRLEELAASMTLDFLLDLLHSARIAGFTAGAASNQQHTRTEPSMTSQFPKNVTPAQLRSDAAMFAATAKVSANFGDDRAATWYSNAAIALNMSADLMDPEKVAFAACPECHGNVRVSIS